MRGKNITEQVRRRRHKLLMDYFRATNRSGDRWMCSISENNPDIVMFISNLMRESISVYSWESQSNWISFSASCVSGMIDAQYKLILYEEAIKDGARLLNCNSIQIGEAVFWVPEKMRDRYLTLANDIIAMVRDEDDHGMD